MKAIRFDSIAKRVASHQFSRRQALARAGAGIGAGTLAVAGLAPTTLAQEATPAAGEDDPTLLFVQAFRSGNIVPKEGAEGRYLLTLEQGLGHTVYFSDRPDRIAGANPTPVFLQRLGFPDDNPPNAALVVETEEGTTEVAVVELFSPTYDEPTHTATYEVAVLAEFERSAGDEFAGTDADLAEVLPTFGTAHLFIDSLGACTGRAFYVCVGDGVAESQSDLGGCCFDANTGGCQPCQEAWDIYNTYKSDYDAHCAAYDVVQDCNDRNCHSEFYCLDPNCRAGNAFDCLVQ